MVVLGFATLGFVILAAVVRSSIAIAAAYALTTLATLPGLVDTLAWLVAGGYTLLNVVGVLVTTLALRNAGEARKRFR